MGLVIRPVLLGPDAGPILVPTLLVPRDEFRVVKERDGGNILNGEAVDGAGARVGAEADDSNRGGTAGKTGRGGGRSATVGMSTATDDDRGN
jgi:hypothetical protein